MSATVALRTEDGTTTERPLTAVTSGLVLAAVPWRTIRSHRGQRHLPGLYWSSTTGGLVVYESRLELARLLLADADREVVGIAAQPFLVSDDGATPCSGLPALPRRRIGARRQRQASSTASTIRASRRARVGRRALRGPRLGARDLERRGPARAANVRFLAGYRRAAHSSTASRVATAAALQEAGLTIASAEAERCLRTQAYPSRGRSLLHLVWSGALRVDSTCALDPATPTLEVHP